MPCVSKYLGHGLFGASKNWTFEQNSIFEAYPYYISDLDIPNQNCSLKLQNPKLDFILNSHMTKYPNF